MVLIVDLCLVDLIGLIALLALLASIALLALMISLIALLALPASCFHNAVLTVVLSHCLTCIPGNAMAH